MFHFYKYLAFVQTLVTKLLGFITMTTLLENLLPIFINYKIYFLNGLVLIFVKKINRNFF